MSPPRKPSKKLTNSVRAVWYGPVMQEGRYALDVEGLRDLIEHVVKWGKPKLFEVYGEDKNAEPEVMRL